MVEKVKTKVEESNSVSFLTIIGYIVVGVALFDFASSYAGYNMTAFLGEASRFSAIALGLLGGALISAGKGGENE